MTVKQLIAKLQEYPEDYTVGVTVCHVGLVLHDKNISVDQDSQIPTEVRIFGGDISEC